MDMISFPERNNTMRTTHRIIGSRSAPNLP